MSDPNIVMSGNVAKEGSTQVIQYAHHEYTDSFIDQEILNALKCPQMLEVKNHIKQSRDKLLPSSADWLIQHADYQRWNEGDDVALLWIHGGQGKGKTMVSIGLIESLSNRKLDGSVVVAYFFCEGSNNAHMTLDGILKGLIKHLVDYQQDLMRCLRGWWDTTRKQYREHMSWRSLWNILFEMLDQCRAGRIYILIDGLDECQDDDRGNFLDRLVRNGLDQPGRIKWLLTSRPMQDAERRLLTGSDQLRISLEANGEHISKLVERYIGYKVNELGQRHSYTAELRRTLEELLLEKAEGTFMWVSVACARLKDVTEDEVLAVLQELPASLASLYDSVMQQLLAYGSCRIVKGCLRLLQVMTLIYRPLNIREVCSATGLLDGEEFIESLIRQSSSFIRIHNGVLELVHHSAREYLTSQNGRSLVTSYQRYGHHEVAKNCLSHLMDHLTVGMCEPQAAMQGAPAMQTVQYAAAFWAEHITHARSSGLLAEGGLVSQFFKRKVLEWFECLSIMGELPRALEVLTMLAVFDEVKMSDFLSKVLRDAVRFLLRHFEAIEKKPMQTYSSGLIFSPQASEVRRMNVDKAPSWLQIVRGVEHVWSPMIQALMGSGASIRVVAFAPDGSLVASASEDDSIHLWNPRTGQHLNRLQGPLGQVIALRFLPDCERILAVADRYWIARWNCVTGQLEHYMELPRPSSLIESVFSMEAELCLAGALSPDCALVVYTSLKLPMKLSNIETREGEEGEEVRFADDHPIPAMAVAFSPDGGTIATGLVNSTIKIWDPVTGILQTTLVGHSSRVSVLAYSPDGSILASGSHDKSIKLWDVTNATPQKTLDGHGDFVHSLDFSPDGGRIISGSADSTINVWDVGTGSLLRTLCGHTSLVTSVAFSPDGTRVISGSLDRTVRLWDATTATTDIQGGGIRSRPRLRTQALDVPTLIYQNPEYVSREAPSGLIRVPLMSRFLPNGRSTEPEWVHSVVISPDRRHIVSACKDAIKLWNGMTGELRHEERHGSAEPPWELVFSPDSSLLAFFSFDWTVTVLNIVSWEKTVLGGYKGPIRANPKNELCFAPGRRLLAAYCETGGIRVWDVRGGSLLKSFDGDAHFLSFSPDCRLLAFAWHDGVKVYDVEKGRIQTMNDSVSDIDPCGFNCEVMAFSPDSKWLAYRINESYIMMWDIETEGLTWFDRLVGTRVSSGPTHQHFIETPYDVSRLRFSEDGGCLITDIGNCLLDYSFKGPHIWDTLPALTIRHRWFRFGEEQIIRIASGFTPTSYDVRGDKVVVGFADGELLIVDIDRAALLSQATTSSGRATVS